jgi:hypothetical protein
MHMMLIAGDAAHVMPPFMGHGLCAGLRDVWNLTWKLNLVLDGNASDSLLDTYQPERRPHASDVIDLSMYLGKIICIPDAAKAAERDEAFFSGKAPPPPAFPSLTDGVLRRGKSGEIQSPAGLLSPHGTVRAGRRVGRFDEVVGPGFVLVSRSGASQARLGFRQREFLEALNARHVVIAAQGEKTPAGALIDADDKFIPFMQAHGIDSMIVRPDFYLYGTVSSPGELNQLVDDLACDLQRHGLTVESAAEYRLAA